MGTPVSNQLRQRKAVSAALGRQKVFVSSKLFTGGGESISRVLVSGEYYDVGDRVLAQLLSGTTPAELELEPAPNET